MDSKKWTFIKIIISIIGLIAAIIAIGQFACPKYEVEIYLRDMETKKNVSGFITYSDKNKTIEIDADNSPFTDKIGRGVHNVRVKSFGYKSKDYTIDSSTKTINIDLEKENGGSTPLNMTGGWNQWHGITLRKGTEINECIINSNGKIGDNAAGFFHSGLEFLRGKTLTLYFSNIEKSEFFDNNRLVKLEYSNGNVVIPSNAALIEREYIDVSDAESGKGIEFVIDPGKFKGRLNFVFYQADLKDLKITAWYK